MTSPALNDPFNPFYDQYSIPREEFHVPDHFDIYAPEFLNTLDFQCLSVISPSLNKGATRWTYGGRWMTIGVYRDEGRDATLRQPSVALSWTRVSTLLTMVDPAGHKLKTGNKVDLYNISMSPALDLTITVVNPTTFTVNVTDDGDTSGVNGAYQPTEPYDFFSNNYVFRLLPSFKLVPWALIQELFTSSAPITTPQNRELYNITTGTNKVVPRGISQTTNYNLPSSGKPTGDRLPLDRRFGQIYDESGNPLKVSYLTNGQATSPSAYDYRYLNKQVGFNSPMMNEGIASEIFFRITPDDDFRITEDLDLRILNIPGDDPTTDSRVYVYDFYGLEINDPLRGPYFSTTLITRDLDKAPPYDNILRDGVNNVPYYSKILYDMFGNRVFGIQTNNATVIRENLLPLSLDRFNRPIKSPIKTIGRLQGF